MSEVIRLNVGGQKISTSKQTLTAIPDSFFTTLLSGRIPVIKDEDGSIFIDRDPKLFAVILNFLRTKELNVNEVDLKQLRHEAEYYGIQPLVHRLMLCTEQDKSSCGDILFHGYLHPPPDPALLCENGELPMPYGRQVLHIKGHYNWLAISYARCICCYYVKEFVGWNLAFISPLLPAVPDHMALNAKVVGTNRVDQMVAIATGSKIRLWSCSLGSHSEIASKDMSIRVDALFFIGSQLVAISKSGKVVVWHAMTHQWQQQSVKPITSYDTGGSFLILGCVTGSISYIDMEKFPLRMKDNELLVNDLYEDPDHEPVTSLSVYLTPNYCSSGNWIEIAYGTRAGVVRIIVQHPETVRQGTQLFQTFTVHRSPIQKVMLSEKHLVSVCSELSHVRTWSISRFRGRISTQPGSTPLSSFKVISLEGNDVGTGVGSSATAAAAATAMYNCSIGPFGHRDENQVFVQRVVPESKKIFVRLASNGSRVCVIESIDGSNITAYCVHECDSASRMGSRSRQYVITGHSNGSIQLWDLATALELHRNRADEAHVGGPTSEELLGLMQDCDLSMSRVSSTVPSRANSERSLVGLMPLQQSSSFSLSAYVGGSQANLRQSPSDVVFNHVAAAVGPLPVSPLGLRLTSSSPSPTVQCPVPKEESGRDDDDDCSGEQVHVNESEEEKEVVVSYCSALQEDESSVTITFFKPEKRDSDSDEEGEKVGGGNADEEDILNINPESLC